MGRYKKVILAIYNSDPDEGTSLLDSFTNEITARFRHMVNSDVSTVDVEIYVSKIIDAVLRNLESFVHQAKEQSDEEFDRWFSVWVYRTINNYARKFIRFCQIRAKIMADDVDLEKEENEKDSKIQFEDDILSSLIGEEFFLEFVKTLTEQETEVLKLKLQNYKQKQIAELLGISEATVSRIMDSLKDKLEKFCKRR